jgi:hypothetical protein
LFEKTGCDAGVLDFLEAGPQQLNLGPTGAEGKSVRVSSLILSPVQ